MSWYRISSVAVSCALALALFAAMGTAQEEKKKGDDSKSAEKDKAKGKLPNHFAKIGLTTKQQDDVRKIAQTFDDKIAQLHKQIQDIEKQIKEQEDAKLAACEKSLTEGQRTALKEARANAEADKSAAAAKKKAGKKPANGDGNKPEEKKPEEKKPEQK